MSQPKPGDLIYVDNPRQKLQGWYRAIRVIRKGEMHIPQAIALGAWSGSWCRIKPKPGQPSNGSLHKMADLMAVPASDRDILEYELRGELLESP